MNPTDWVSTNEMAALLGVARVTLMRVKDTGYVREDFHFYRKNPTSKRGAFLWHKFRTLEKFGRI